MHFYLPEWPVDFGASLRVALSLLAAVLLGELGRRLLKLPRLLGWAAAGIACGPTSLGLLNGDALWEVRHWVSVAIAFLLFELGQRVDFGWLKRNPWMLATSLAEAMAVFGAVFAVLRLIDTPPLLASMASAIAIATGPTVTLTLSKELRAQGQVTERMLLFTALNNVYAYLTVTVLLAWLHSAYRGGWQVVALHPLYLIFGSAALAVVLASFALWLLRALGRWPDAQLMGLAALLLLAVALAESLKLSVALVALGMGTMTRIFDSDRRFAHLDFGHIGRLLVIVLVSFTAAGINLAYAATGVIAGIALIAARHAGRTLVLFALARPSGLALRKASLLALTLTPMSAVALLMVDQTASLFPEFGPALSAIMFAAIATLEIAGPLLTEFALRRAGETGDESVAARRGA